MRPLLVCAVVALCLAQVVLCVDRSNFKQCKDASFCSRLRATTPEADSYAVMRESLRFTKGKLTAEVLNEAEVSFSLEIVFPSTRADLIRVSLRESTPLVPRFEPNEALLDPVAARETASPEAVVLEEETDSVVVIALPQLGRKLRIVLDPLVVTLEDANGLALVALNSRNLLAFEHTRTKPVPEVVGGAGEGEDAAPTPQADQLKAEEAAGMWEESWKGTTDSKKHGPQGVALDIDFPAFKHVYGIPEHAAPFSLPDTTGDEARYSDPYRLYNLDVFEYELDNEMALYGAVPFMVAHSAAGSVGALWLNAAETFIDVTTLGGGGRGSRWMSETGVIDVFLMVGPAPADVLAQYAGLTGAAALPPVFSISYHQCRWNYRDEDDVRMVDAKFDEHNIPYDVLWLDIEHTDGKRYFTWDATKFPAPKAMIDGLAAKGRKMVTIIDPHIKRDNNYYVYRDASAAGHFIKDASGSEYDGFCWPGSSAWLDLVSPAVRDYWASLFAFDTYVGSTPTLFTWNDMNEPSVFNGPEITMKKDAIHFGGWEHRDVHNMYGMLFQRSTAAGQLARSGGKARPFVLTRSFFVSSQRDGAVWTGDNAAEWSHLEASVPMLLSHSIAGIPFIGADVGGFFGDVEPELLARWYQAGAFQPFFRAHGHLDTKRREPWLFGEPYTSIIRSAIRARYAYLPYLYTLFAEASRTLAPVMRPLWWHYPDHAPLFDRDSEFMLGRALLIAPATAPGVTSVTAYLPPGAWYDVRDFAMYQGGQLVPLDAPLESIPVLQAAGTIVPKKERARRNSAAMVLDPFTLVVALDAAGSARGELYLDDGASTDHAAGAWTSRHFSMASGMLTSTRAPGAPEYHTPEAIERIVVLGMPAPAAITLNGDSLSFTVDPTSGAVTIRKPDVLAIDDWTIVFA
ncbi:glycosyl hydrolase family 31 protein [Thecamonas trahens ATCC 50062]|uniref:Glucosidase II subunit alpha n=1 Tax=Thecamonas trahens ATCC 50062 TaxID=461836 RepID=A0A0L0DJQ9_THETB|nr:glycosyl hydrolase family 31 protein [Thecamonas trahens ATCC 50062]KNC52351.1 glycosyl hydrolase family 31 protein [Thecamonas trahens ATCC 50062]|eukprot:XP_013755401.1 glycosyl hydrolase family 31 protein [Thecamonas trahens ATCC 50062]